MVSNKILGQTQSLSKTGLEIKAAGVPAVAHMPKAAPAMHVKHPSVGMHMAVGPKFVAKKMPTSSPIPSIKFK